MPIFVAGGDSSEDNDDEDDDSQESDDLEDLKDLQKSLGLPGNGVSVADVLRKATNQSDNLKVQCEFYCP